MLSNNELSFAIFGCLIIFIVTYVSLRIMRGSKIPKGSILENDSSSSEVNRTPVNPIALLIIFIGAAIVVIHFVMLFGHCLSNSWESSDLYAQAIRFPVCINYIGIIIALLCQLLKAFALVYNINFTPAFLPMKEGYTLATGGPYKFVRHPKYLCDILGVLSLFMMTGIKVLIIGFICVLFFVFQAYSEEKALQKIFGKDWDAYASKTGMFIPKLING